MHQIPQYIQTNVKKLKIIMVVYNIAMKITIQY